MATNREPLFDLPIEPRPEPEPVPEPQLPPEPDQPLQKQVMVPNLATVVIPQPMGRAIAPKGYSESEGVDPATISKSDVLLESIRITASKPPSFITTCALRALIRDFAHQYSLDF
jgi:hypothetical protein